MKGTDEQLCWIWDLRPLSREAWGNLQYPDDGTAAGQVTKVRRAMGMYNGEHRTILLRPGQSKPSMKMMTFSRKFYVPIDEDIRIVRERCPGASNPENPPLGSD